MPYAVLQRITADAPGYERVDGDGKRKERIRITDENADELMRQINAMTR